MEQTPMDDIETTPDEERGGIFYLIGALAVLLIPVIVGIVMANTGGEGDEDTSGMTAATGVVIETTQATGPARTNLSPQGAVTETSSNFSDNFAGSNAIDGSLATEWSSRGDGDDAYIVIDLGSTQSITGIGFRTREMGDGTAITNTYTVTVDDSDELGPFPAGVGMTVSDFTATGRVVRIDMDTTTGGNTGAIEIEIYGS